MTDPFRELKKLVDRGFDGMLPCVEVDKGIICGDNLKPSEAVFFSWGNTCPIPSKASWKLACTLDYHQQEAGGPFVNATTPRSSYHLFFKKLAQAILTALSVFHVFAFVVKIHRWTRNFSEFFVRDYKIELHQLLI